MVILGMTFTSCTEDTHPRLQWPTEFKLNTPVFADLTYNVEEGGSIDFSCSQANYVVATTPTYQLEISVTEEFEKTALVDYTTTKANMTIPAEPFAMAVCSLYGWTDPSEVKAVPLYVRCISTVPHSSDRYTIASNIVPLKSVLVYFAVKLPDAIYLVGQPQGWAQEATWPIYETEVGSKIYKGEYEIPEGQFQFRFYDEVGDWNKFSIGAQDADSPVDITMTDGVYEGSCKYDPTTDETGKGSWQVPDWAGGKIEITVNLNNLTVVFRAV